MREKLYPINTTIAKRINANVKAQEVIMEP